jgi:hypothetical protein
MFRNAINLTTIYVGSNWNTSNVSYSTYMFTNSKKIVGGAGTTYNASHVNNEYARIDNPPSNPGYFTAAGSKGTNSLNSLAKASVNVTSSYTNIDECNNNCGTTCLLSGKSYVCPSYSCEVGILSGTECYSK